MTCMGEGMYKRTISLETTLLDVEPVVPASSLDPRWTWELVSECIIAKGGGYYFTWLWRAKRGY
jgi:hypothetical protein